VVSPAPPRSSIRLILADRAVATLIGLALLVMLGVGLVLPILPLYARSFDVGYAGVGIIVGAYALTRLVTDIVGGPVIDRVGERIVAAAGLLVVACSALLTGLAPAYALAVLFWAGAGVGSAFVFSAMYSHLLKLVPRERMARTLSVFYGAFNAGVIAGGFLAGVIAGWLGLAAPLFVTAGTSLVAAALYLRLLPRQRIVRQEHSSEPGGLSRLGAVLRTPGIGTALATNLAYLWMVAAVFDTLVPLFASDELGMSTVGIGVVFAIALVAEFVVLYPAGSLADRIGRRAVLIPSLAALALATVAVGWASTAVLLGGALALLGLASGAAGVPPAAVLSDVVERERSGTAVGVFRFFGDLGFTIGPLVAGLSAGALGFRGAFALAAVPTALALVVVIRSAETLRAGTISQPEPNP
jgi:MFS family permease